MRLPLHRHVYGTTARAQLASVLDSGQLAGQGHFGDACEAWLQAQTGCSRALMTPSGTLALFAALSLAGIGPGDEVIVPAWTFAGTAAVVSATGATPVLVDVTAGNLNINLDAAARAVGERTRAIIAVHYAGNPCDGPALRALCDTHGLVLIEDAAQALLARHAQTDTACGQIGDFAALSFHSTKNVGCGEGGALLVNGAHDVPAAEALTCKGTDFSAFRRGQVPEYGWVGAGITGGIPETSASLLHALLLEADGVTQARRAVWHGYQMALAGLPVRCPNPVDPGHNAHIFHVRLAPDRNRGNILAGLNAAGIGAAAHYPDLASSAAGQRYARVAGTLSVASDAAHSLLRLPIWPGMTENDIDFVVETLKPLL